MKGALTVEEVKFDRVKAVTFTKITTFLQSDKGRRWLIVIGAIGVLLLALPEILPSKGAQVMVETSAEEFVQKTEERLGGILGSIEGAGKCQIMITLENGVEYVYATEQKTNTDRQENSDDTSNKVVQRDDSEETVILVDTENGRKGLLVTEIQPTVKGVVVVCEGGDREEVRERVIQAVTVALNISSKRVCVTKLS